MFGLNKGISVIIPVYNGEQYLDECLYSLFNQTFRKNLEYIFVIDKNSTDNSEEIIKKEVKSIKNAKIIKPQKGSSQGYNRNFGFKYVSKDYIGFCDSDDWVDLDFYERLYDYSQICSADIAIGNTVLYSQSRQENFNKTEYPFQIEYSIGKVFAFLKWNTVWDKIFNTKMIKQNREICFPEGVIHEDNVFVINAVYSANKVVTVPGSYYHWRRYPSSTSTIPIEGDKYKNDAFIVFNMILDSMEKMNIPKSEKIIVFKQILSWAKSAFNIDVEKNNYLAVRIEEVTGFPYKIG